MYGADAPHTVEYQIYRGDAVRVLPPALQEITRVSVSFTLLYTDRILQLSIWYSCTRLYPGMGYGEHPLHTFIWETMQKDFFYH